MRKKWYIVEEENSNENDDEVVYVAMKDDSDEDEEIVLVTYMNKNEKWIIDSGCSHHMTRDKVSPLPLLDMMEIVLDLVTMHHVKSKGKVASSLLKIFHVIMHTMLKV